MVNFNNKNEVIQKVKEIWQIKSKNIETDFNQEIIKVLPELEFLLHASNSYIHIADTAKMEFAYISKSTEQVLGYAIDTWKKMGIHFGLQIYNLEDMPASRIIHDHLFAHLLQQPLDERKYFRYTDTFRMQHKNGHLVWILNHLVILASNSDGSPHMVMSYGTDITPVKLDNDIIYIMSKFNFETGTYDNLFTQIYKTDCTELLTAKEQEILKLLSKGNNNSEIAKILNISEYTVQEHRQNMLKKTNLKNTCHLLKEALNNALI